MRLEAQRRCTEGHGEPGKLVGGPGAHREHGKAQGRVMGRHRGPVGRRGLGGHDSLKGA